MKAYRPNPNEPAILLYGPKWTLDIEISYQSDRHKRAVNVYRYFLDKENSREYKRVMRIAEINRVQAINTLQAMYEALHP